MVYVSASGIVAMFDRVQDNTVRIMINYMTFFLFTTCYFPSDR